MPLKHIIDLLIPFGTILAAIFAGISALVAAKAINLQRNAIRAQTFIDILSYEREINFSHCMDVIRGLTDGECKDYKKFINSQPDKDKQIRQAVDFLNHLAHLVRHGYIKPEHILILYTASIDACRKMLLGKDKWLDGFRKNAGSYKYYLNFECLCNNLENLWRKKKFEWPDSQIRASKEMQS
jgi:hypothetical protein